MKDASELIALADEIEQSHGLARMTGDGLGAVQIGIKKTAQVVSALRAAAATGSERVGVDALRDVFAADWQDVEEDDPDVIVAAHAIAEDGVGRPWDDFLPTSAYDMDQSDLIEYGRAAVAALRAKGSPSTPPAQPAPVSGEPQLCAGGVEPGFDECPECGATWEDDCKFETQNSDGGVESRVAAVPLEIPAQRSGESRDPLGDGSVKVGPHREDAAGVAPGPSEAPSTHGKPDGAVREACKGCQNTGWCHAKNECSITGFSLSALAHSPKIAAADDDTETCIACNIAFVEGDLIYPDQSGGCIHVSCCGPEMESYVNADGEPLKDGDPLPTPQRWMSAAAETNPGDVLAWQWFSGGSWQTVDKTDVENPEQYARSISKIVRPIYAAIDRLDVKAEAKSQEPETVAVKPLEWRNGVAGSCTLIADTILGRYAAWYIEPHGVWRSPTASPGILCGNSLDAAKAAAQADYEQRIRSALIHPTKPEAPAVSVDAIARIIDPVTFAKFDAEIQKDRKAQNICADSFFEYRNVRCRNVFVGLSISSESNGLLTSGSIGNRPGFKNVDLFAVGI